MPNLSDLVLFHSGQARTSIDCSWDKLKKIYYNSFLILKNYYALMCCVEHSVDSDLLTSSEAN